ncbi:MAG: S8 family serine peptidase [Rickettsiales bacterium]|jgi:hypothetical protein|nr:S8 family serine peptidase [Rickettsiales bacterium]
MSLLKTIFIGFLCSAIFVLPAAADENHDCGNSLYRKYHPENCKNFTKSPIGSALSIAGGALIVGTGIMLATMVGGGSDSDYSSKQSSYQPTMRIYDNVGYTDPTALNAVLANPCYNRNFDHYNEIRLAYSLARGYTGKNANIAILDTADYSWHGAAVANIAGAVIASDAVVTPYKIVDEQGEFLSYAQIGNVISSAHDATIFNSSWGISTTESRINAYSIKTRAQMIALTDETFVNSLVSAARNKDAIFVWSVGNDGTPQPGALTALPRVIPELDGHFINVVAWDTDAGALAWYSNQCGITKNYCITAPGSGIDVGTVAASGTSFAAPMVSGAVAVLKEAFPYMAAAEITKLLFATARDLGAEGVDEVYGWGMLDLERATRPVGAALVPLADEMQPLQTTRVSGVIGRKLKSANLTFAFFDSFGRAFDAHLNDNIIFETRGRAFDRLRGKDPQAVINTGGFEFGFTDENLLIANGFLETDKNNLTSFFGLANEFSIGEIRFFQNARLGVSVPAISEDSFISEITGIGIASAKFGMKWRDWTVSAAAPNTIIAGKMNLRLPMGRTNTGNFIFADYNIDLAERPALEYSIGYKFLTASFIDNHREKDELFIMAKAKLAF